MSIEEDLRAVLLADTNVAALIGTRVYPLMLPDDAATPAIIYQEIDAIGERTLGGHFIATARRYQLRLAATSYDMIVQLKAAVAGVDSGPNGGYTRLFIDDGPDGYEFDTKLYTKILEAQISV
jgi:hypothetical protein